MVLGQSGGVLLLDIVKFDDQMMHSPSRPAIPISSISLKTYWTDSDLPKTLDKELRAAVPQGTTFNIKAPATRDTSIWLGGSILADVEPFQEKWINREEYQQTGPDIITNKQM